MPNFPTSLDSLANPTATTLRNDPGFELHTVISTLNDIAEALEAKLGIGASTPGGSAAVLRRTASGASAWGALQTGDMAALTANYVVRADGSGVVGAGLLGAANVADGAMPMQLASFTVTGSPAAFAFTSIPQTYRHLLLVAHLRSSVVSPTTNDSAVIQLNTDTGTNYYGQRVYGAGATAAGLEHTPGSTSMPVGAVPGKGTPTANYFSALVAFFPAYSSTTGFKSVLSLNNLMLAATTGNFNVNVFGMEWSSASAITRIDLKALTTPFTFEIGSMATLYGLN